MTAEKEAPMTTLADNSYPLFDVFWSIVIFFLFVMWIWILIAIFADVFSRHDMSGGMKALWTCALLFIPLFGVLMYMITQSSSMAERRMQSAQAQQKQIASYVTPNGSGGATEIAKAKELLDSGAIDQAEFDQIKQKALVA
jgi:hypothetical protein